MKRAWVALLLALSTSAISPRHLERQQEVGAHCLTLFAQGRELPGQGNPGHHEPAPGENCVHDEKDPAHNCSCHRECKQNTDEDGNPSDGEYVKEDAKCRVYCFKD